MEDKLNKLLYKIFKNHNIDNMTHYEKRKTIFKYLANNISYDEDLLNKIKNKSIIREPKKEILDVLDNNKGICNSISQVYMLLLEKIGIESICICCDDSTDVYHQLNIVKDNDDFSFDDITYAIFSENKLDRFNYTVEKANEFEQGLKEVYDLGYWVIIPPSLIYASLGKPHNDDIEDFKKFVDNINDVKRI